MGTESSTAESPAGGRGAFFSLDGGLHGGQPVRSSIYGSRSLLHF